MTQSIIIEGAISECQGSQIIDITPSKNTSALQVWHTEHRTGSQQLLKQLSFWLLSGIIYLIGRVTVGLIDMIRLCFAYNGHSLDCIQSYCCWSINLWSPIILQSLSEQLQKLNKTIRRQNASRCLCWNYQCIGITHVNHYNFSNMNHPLQNITIVSWNIILHT